MSSEKGERVGVFVCHCGTNIAGVVDVTSVLEGARGLEGVVHAEDGKWICSVDFLNKIKAAIKEKGLDRVVVACCTPRTHEPVFRSALKEAGLNPFLLELVSIREGCSWVHSGEPAAATAKALELVKMGVARARLLEPLEVARIPVGKEALVIGGGPAGMAAALGLARQGMGVKLVERRERLGGMLLRLARIFPENKPAADILAELEAAVRAEPGIEVMMGAEVLDIRGFVGSYTARVLAGGEERELRASIIIVATGMEELPPEGAAGHGVTPGVMTLLEFLDRLGAGYAPSSVAFIGCVRSRNGERGCCSVGCLAAIGAAELFRERVPGSRTVFFYRDLCIPGPAAGEAAEMVWRSSVLTFRYPEGEPPEVRMLEAPAEKSGQPVQQDTQSTKRKEEAGKGDDKKEGGGRGSAESRAQEGTLGPPEQPGNMEGLEVVSRDILTGRRVRFPAEAVVLVTGYRGAVGAERLAGLLKVSTGPDGFFTEAHVKLRPLDFATEGIYVCGCARGPRGLKESIEEGLGAAMRALIPMRRGFVESEGVVAMVDSERCSGCGLCASSCPFSAIEMVDGGVVACAAEADAGQPPQAEGCGPATAPASASQEGGGLPGSPGVREPAVLRGAGKRKRPGVIPALCRGCGVCAADCPNDAIQLTHFTDGQILAQLEAALESEPEKKIIAFCCHWCALGAADMAGVSRLQYPHNVRIIRVMCSGRVDAGWVERALERGAAAVVIMGCEFPTCHYIEGNYRAERRVERMRRALAKKGLPVDRIRTLWLSAADGPKFAAFMRSLAEELGL
ncbi:MAG: hydrogenase iron-sulfur subunit [Thermoplasmata archaeon]